MAGKAYKAEPADTAWQADTAGQADTAEQANMAGKADTAGPADTAGQDRQIQQADTTGRQEGRRKDKQRYAQKTIYSLNIKRLLPPSTGMNQRPHLWKSSIVALGHLNFNHNCQSIIC
jgi:hypothetical protein